MSRYFEGMRWRRFAGSVLAGTLLTAAWAAAGTSYAGASSSAGAKPYTIQYDLTLTGGGVSFPATPAVLKAAFHGLPVHIVDCDDMNTTSGNIDCEHQAVVNHAAIVMEATTNEDQSVLEQAGIPEIGNTNTTSSNSFDLSGNNDLFVGMGVALHKLGCQRLGALADDGAQSFIAQSVDSEKWKTVTQTFMPYTALDISPYVAKLVDAHVQCIAMASLPAQLPKILLALKQAHLKVPVALPSAILTSQVHLGSLANGLIEVETTADPASNSPVITAVAHQMHAINRSLQVTATTLDTWAWAQLIKEAAATIHGTVDAITMMNALNHLRNAGTDGLNPPISMTPLSNPNYLRSFDNYVISYRIEHGKPTDSSGFFNVASQLDALPH